jgi:8-oxo-dGTP diphosphatase
MKLVNSDREIIVLGVLYNETRDKVLLSRRRPDVHAAGLWELPGGKVNADETCVEALKREFEEELNIIVDQSHSLIRVDHDYPDIKIQLNAFVIDKWSGTPQGREGQLTEWVPVKELDAKQFPEANRQITKLIGLPALYLITPDQPDYDLEFLQRTVDYLQNGLKLIQFRSNSSSFLQHEQAVSKLIQHCDQYSTRLLYNGTAEQAIDLGAHGVHLNSARLLQCQSRPLPNDKWVAASCHNALELEHAAAIGVDFCVLSPVYQTESHSLQSGIGWDQFSYLAGQSRLPVYALGGVKAEHLPLARDSGAHGIAMISGIWENPDPLTTIRNLTER